MWLQNLLKKEIQHVISGKSQVRFGAANQTVASYLSAGTKPGTSVKNAKSLKQQETKRFETFATEHNPLRGFAKENQVLYFKDTVFYLKDAFWLDMKREVI